MKSHSGEQVNLLGSCFPVKGMSYERNVICSAVFETQDNCLNCPASARIISSFDFKHRTAYNISTRKSCAKQAFVMINSDTLHSDLTVILVALFFERLGARAPPSSERMCDGFIIDRNTRSQKGLGNVCSVKTVGTYRNKHKV